MTRVEELATHKPKKLPWWNCFGDEFSWVDGSGVLLDNYCMWLCFHPFLSPHCTSLVAREGNDPGWEDQV